MVRPLDTDRKVGYNTGMNASMETHPTHSPQKRYAARLPEASIASVQLLGDILFR